MVTLEELRRVMPHLQPDKARAYLPDLQAAMEEAGITTYLREAAFLAQLAHESGQLRYMEELADGSAYEGRRDLGNVLPGDGRRFKGRGPIQLTGRANYIKYGALLGVDLIQSPSLAATPKVGFRIAACYWRLHGLNELADQKKFTAITRRINGGINGLQERQAYYAAALAALSHADAPVPFTEDDTDETALHLSLDGVKEAVNGDSTPAYLDGQGASWVPLRAVAEYYGATISMVAGDQATLLVSGQNRKLPVIILGQRAFAPSRAAAEALGLTLSWDQAGKTVGFSR